MMRIRGAAAMACALGQPMDAYLRALVANPAAQFGPQGRQDTYIAVVEHGEGIDDVAAEIG